MSRATWYPRFFCRGSTASFLAGHAEHPDLRDADLSRESRGRVSNEASSAGRRTADVPDGSGAAIRRMLLADESHTKGGISTMAKKAAKGGKKKGGKKR